MENISSFLILCIALMLFACQSRKVDPEDLVLPESNNSGEMPEENAEDNAEGNTGENTEGKAEYKAANTQPNPTNTIANTAMPASNPLPEQSAVQAPMPAPVPTVNETAPLQSNAVPISIPVVSEINEFSSAPYLVGSRRELAGGEAPEEYIVEYGDSLFDICDQLLGDGGYWPKLWSMNTFIKNPHFIWPGMRLRFYPGDDASPPYLQVISEADAVAIPSENVDMASLVDEVFFAPSNLHNFLMDHVSNRDDFNHYSGSVSSFGMIKDAGKILVTVPGFIFDQKPREFCIVEKGLEGEAFIGEDALLSCTGDRVNELDDGGKYTVLRLAPTSDVDQIALNGQLYNFVANVDIKRKVDRRHAYAKSFHTRLAIVAGDIVVPYLSTYRYIDMTNTQKDRIPGSADIISFEIEGQRIGGFGHMLFLNKGEDDGVKVGQNLAIYQGKNKFLDTGGVDADEETPPIGMAQIIDATESGSVAYITNNQREVMLGDHVASF